MNGGLINCSNRLKPFRPVPTALMAIYLELGVGKKIAVVAPLLGTQLSYSEQTNERRGLIFRLC